MLFRLSRVSFWLTAALAAATLFAPGGHETGLTVGVLIGCAAAFTLWRSGISVRQREPADALVVPAVAVLTEASLRDVMAMLVHEADAAGSFEAALHGVARVLRGELGARLATIHAVGDIDATHAQLHDLIEAQPGFRASARPVRLDHGAIGLAIRTRTESGVPPGSVVVPAVGAGRVVALIELNGIEVGVEPKALADLLALARQTLSRLAPCAAAAPLASHMHAQVLVVEDNVAQPEAAQRMLRGLGCRTTAASGMLDSLSALDGTQFSPGDAPRPPELGFDDHVCKPTRRDAMPALLSQHLRPHAPDGQPDSGAAGRVTPAAPTETPFVLDPAALARLAELDPKGKNHLLARVLQAFQTSVARLRPQVDAARLSGDLAGLRLVAHTLKSSSASIGAMQLSHLCAQIETTIRAASVDDLDAQLDAFDVALDSALRAIEQLLKEPAR